MSALPGQAKPSSPELADLRREIAQLVAQRERMRAKDVTEYTSGRITRRTRRRVNRSIVIDDLNTRVATLRAILKNKEAVP